MRECCARRYQYADELARIRALIRHDSAEPGVRALVAERDALQRLVLALAERVLAQSELLSKRAER